LKSLKQYILFSKMTISYAAVRNHHAKVTMPSIENGWYTSGNIQKDPPKSISTRRIDKVSDTMATNIMIAESPDRQCEAINYYARGVNPMVSVNYGQGQSGTQAYLPYTVARDGAFRPPVLYGVTNLLPLSRLPRILTNVCATPYQPIFTKRIRDCGTAEQTREVKSHLLRAACEAQKVIQTEPDLNEPITALQIRDDIVYQNVKTRPSFQTEPDLNEPITALQIRDNIVYQNVKTRPNCPTNAEEIRQKLNTLPIHLTANRPSCSASTTGAAAIKTGRDLIEKYDTLVLAPNKPNTDGYTNYSANKESPVVFNNVHLEPSRPYTTATTSLVAPGTGFSLPQEYRRLQERPSLGGFAGSRQIPRMLDNPVKHLTR
jgi:hypothetical protein